MFKPNLANPPDGPIFFPKLYSYKLDGIRVLTKFGTTLTRTLKPVPNLHIREMLEKYPGLDGEVIVGSPAANDVCRKSMSAVSTIEGEPQFTFYVFDKLDCDLPFDEKYKLLVEEAKTWPPYIELLYQTLIESKEDADSFYAFALDMGYEGAMARNPKAKYKFGRSTAKSQDLLKLKEHHDDEAVIESVYEAMHNENEATIDELGHTKRSSHQENLVPAGMIGGFNVLYKGTRFKVAPGKISHDERKALWQIRDTLVGKKVKFRAMAYGQKDAPRQGRALGVPEGVFLTIREDFDI